MSFQIRVDNRAVVDGLNRIASGIAGASEAGLKQAAEDGFNDSQRLVHVRTGFLKRSGGIKQSGPEKVVYGYDAYYATEEEFGNSRRPPHPYVTPRYNVLANGLAADYVYRQLTLLL